jgi:zinc protease
MGVAGPVVNDSGGLDAAAPAGSHIVALHQQLSALLPRLYQDVTPRLAPPVHGRQLLVVEKETASTGIHFGHPLAELHRGHPDWPAMVLALTAFGEHRQSHGRLYGALRGDRGLNYGDYAYVEIYRQQGWSSRQLPGSARLQNPFYVWIRPVTSENGPFALKAAVVLLEDFVETGLEEDEFFRMQTYLSARIALWAADPSRRLAWAVEARALGFPDPIGTLPAKVAELTRQEVHQAIQRHIDPSALKIVVVTGDGQAFVDAVTGEGPTHIVYDSQPPEPSSAQAEQDADWAAFDLGLDDTEVVDADGILR